MASMVLRTAAGSLPSGSSSGKASVRCVPNTRSNVDRVAVIEKLDPTPLPAENTR